jgi:hypothetical protein
MSLPDIEEGAVWQGGRGIAEVRAASGAKGDGLPKVERRRRLEVTKEDA